MLSSRATSSATRPQLHHAVDDSRQQSSALRPVRPAVPDPPITLGERLRASRLLAPLTGLTTAAIGLLALSRVGISFTCPFLWFTGWQCPLCGATRAFGHLLAGDLMAAWRFNEFVMVLSVVLAILLIADIARVVRAPSREALASAPSRSRRPIFNWALVISAITFTVLRNIF